MNDIKEHQFLKEHGINIPPFKRKAWREEHLTEEDWYRGPKKGDPVMLRPSGQQRLLVADAVEEIVPLAVQRFESLVVLRAAKNPKWVWCEYEDVNLGRVKVPVLCGKFAKRCVKGKVIRCQVIESEDGNKTFRFEKLAQ